MAGLLGAVVAGQPAEAQHLPDRGIGGTGVVADDLDPGLDRGIGGTGVVGTIRQFGSIMVNDLRISYPDGVEVTIDGEQAPGRALKLGHVVQVIADREAGGLSTRAIAVTSEAVGRIEHVSRNGLVVAGQCVSTGALAGKRRWRVGRRIAVSGLRKPDGVIVASLIEPSRRRLDRVAGVLALDADGALAIGSLKLVNVDLRLIGSRVVVDGRMVSGRLVAMRAEHAPTALASARANRFSVEAFIQRDGERLLVGSGLPFELESPAAELPAKGVFRAILLARRGAEGQLVVDSIKVQDRQNAQDHALGSSRPFGRAATPGRSRAVPPTTPGGSTAVPSAAPHGTPKGTGSSGGSRGSRP